MVIEPIGFPTLIYATGYLAFTLIFNGLGGYVLSRVKPRGYNFVFLLMFWTMMMPTAVTKIYILRVLQINLILMPNICQRELNNILTSVLKTIY